MDNVIQLRKYRQDVPQAKDNTVRVAVEEQQPEVTPHRFIVRNPLFVSADSLIVMRERLSQNINMHEPTHLFMPITSDLEPFWEMDVEQGWFNSWCSPFTALFAAVRDYPMEFTQIVDGRMVNYQKDYDRILADFNAVHMKAMENRGSGYPRGTLSVDEFLRMTSLFYCLLMTADKTHGVVFDKMGHLCNGWSGDSRIVNMSYKLASFYSDRLAKCQFTGVKWDQFMFQAVGEHGADRVSWLFNLTKFDVMQGSKEWDFSFQDFFNLLDMIRFLDPTQHQVTVMLQNTAEIRQFLGSFYKSGLRYDQHGLGKKYSVISNYRFQ